MKKLLIFLIFSLYLSATPVPELYGFYGDDENNCSVSVPDIPYEMGLLDAKRKMGLSLCLREFYKDLPKQIADGYKAFQYHESINPDEKTKITKFIRKNIKSYLPEFKEEGIFREYEPWYYVACIRLYESIEFRNFLLTLSKGYVTFERCDKKF